MKIEVIDTLISDLLLYTFDYQPCCCHLLSECGWTFLPQIGINVHDLIVDDSTQNLQRLDIKLNLTLSLFLLNYMEPVE